MKMSSFWKKIKKPIMVLAPMAGYTDSAFRILCRENGADVVMTELISADAVAYAKFKVRSSTGSDRPEQQPNGRSSKLETKVESNKNHTTAELLSFFEAERPIVVQLFGKKPENFAKAAKWVTQELKPDGIDINMGCPARKVIKSGHGAALIKEQNLAVSIVKAVKENTNLPVSVKTRLGWEKDDEILEFGPKLVEAGADALIVHGRTYADGFKNNARWENIYKLKEILGKNVIVIGNGDIGSMSDVKCKMSNLDGIAVGRATFGNPFIFSKIKNAKLKESSSLSDLILCHAQLAFESKGERGIIEFRKHLLGYLKGFPDAKNMRKVAVAVSNLTDVENITRLIKKAGQ